MNEKRIAGNVFNMMNTEREYEILNHILLKYNMDFLKVFYSNGEIRIRIERFDEYYNRKIVIVLCDGNIKTEELTMVIIDNIINFRKNETDYVCAWNKDKVINM